MDWSIKEVELIVLDYFSMLSDELDGKPINKTIHRDGLKKLINRTDGSIEYKHQNISAVLAKLGLPYIKGYKPAWNFQSLLEQEITKFLADKRSALESRFLSFSDTEVSLQREINFDKILDSPPERRTIAAEAQAEYQRRPMKINYLEREQRNSSIGGTGEEIAIEFEKWRLINLGKEKLVDQIEWISKNDDGAGFDILSKNENGSDRYIEVKATKLTKETPIYFSQSEYNFSVKNSANYHLYRVFKVKEDPRLFCLNGDFDLICSVKEVVQYKGYF